MRDTLAKFGTFAAIDANGQGRAANSKFWASITTLPPMGQRDQWISAREIPAVGSPGGRTLADVQTFFARPEWQSILSQIGLSLINNCEIEIKDPIKGSTGSEAVTGVGSAGTGDDALVWHDTDKPANARWAVASIVNQYPGAAPFTVLLPGNEPDGNCNRFCAYAPTGVGQTIGTFSYVSKLDRTTVLTRLAAMLKAVYEELKTDKRSYAKHKFGGVVPCYANTGVAMQNLYPPPGLNYSVYHFFNHNNGEMLRYCDVIANHLHDFAAAFDTTNVARNTISTWHLWTAIQQGQALAGTGAIHPIYCNEGGVQESGMDTTQASPWNHPEDAGNLMARRLLKTRRQGMMLCTLFYWSYSFWILYNHNGSGATGQIWVPSASMDGNPPWTPREPCWTAIKRQFDPSLYAVIGRPPWSLPITAKPWTDLTDTATQAAIGYHDPATWAILGDLYKPEKADPASADIRTWHEWDRATITDNRIAFTAPVAGQGNQTNRAMRPVILPGHGRYRVNCTVAGNAGTARLIARGWNALDGLATTAGQSGSETTAPSAVLTATFTTVPHDVKHFPNLPKVAVVLECTASASYSDVTIEPA